MPDPIATGRIQLPYTQSGITHLLHAWVRNITTIGGGAHNINTRATDSNDLDWNDAAEGLWASVSYLLTADAVPGTAVLQKFTDHIWEILDSHTFSTTNGSGAVSLASEFTLNLRDDTFLPFKVIVLDTTQTPPHAITSPLAGTAAEDNFIKQWTLDATVTNAPAGWQVSRNNRYIADNPFVRATSTFNRHLSKRRGLK